MARTRVTMRDSTRILEKQPRTRTQFELAEEERPEAAAALARQCSLQARYAAAAAVAAAAPALPMAGLETLPHEVLLRIFAALPVDTRLVACAVARSWARFLASPVLWQTLDLSPAGGVARRAVHVRLLRAAAARAAGTLHTLDVSDCVWLLGTESFEYLDLDHSDSDKEETDEDLAPRSWLPVHTLRTVLAANAGTLRCVRALCGAALCAAPAAAGLRPPQLTALLASAPRLRELHADVACMPSQAPALLRGDGDAAPLRLRRLTLCGVYKERTTDAESANDNVATPELLTQLREHPSLCELALDRVRLEGEGAVRALAGSGNITGLCLLAGSADLGISGALAPELLTLLLRAREGPPLRTLRMVLLAPDALAASELGVVLRSAPGLRELSLQCAGLQGTPPPVAPEAAAALAAALTGHATLQRLWLRDLHAPPEEEGDDDDDDDVGGGGSAQPSPHELFARRLLAALLEDAPALEALHVSGPAFVEREHAGAPRALLDTLARSVGAGGDCDASGTSGSAARGAPRLRHLSLPAEGLEALCAADVRAAAPALRTLQLLRCDDEYECGYNLFWCRRGRGAARRWVHEVDLLNEERKPKRSSEEEEEEEE
jgi:hypothetical protein